MPRLRIPRIKKVKPEGKISIIALIRKIVEGFKILERERKAKMKPMMAKEGLPYGFGPLPEFKLKGELAPKEIGKPMGIEIPTKPWAKIFIPTRPDEFEEELRGIDIYYPLIPYSPKKGERVFAYARIKWDPKEGALFYSVIEPKISPEDKELIEKIKKMLEERLDISFTKLGKINAKELLRKEIEQILSVMPNIPNDKKEIFTYYIERDTTGFGKIEPFMNDMEIEDISCDGEGIPMYVYHRDPRFASIKTNVKIETKEELDEFVMRLAQGGGKMISVAEPLLDAALPDGSRLQATLGTDIARRGSNFTIRKFTEKPLTPTHMLKFKTMNSTQLAFLWLAIEYGKSMLVSGGTATGKCIAPTEPIQLADGEIKPIETVFRERLGNIPNPPVEVSIPANKSNGTDVLTFNQNTLKIIRQPVSRYWRMAAPKKLISVGLDHLSEILTTPEHPFFTIEDGELKRLRADFLAKGDYVAIPRKLPINGKKQDLNLLDYFDKNDLIYAFGISGFVNEILNKLKKRFGSYKSVAKHFDIEPRTMLSWKENNSMPLGWLRILGEEAGYRREKIWKRIEKIKGKTSKLIIKTAKTISDKLLKIAAYIMADGTICKNQIILTNSNHDLLKDFLESIKGVFGIKGTIRRDKNTYNAVVHSSVTASILEKVFEIPKGKKSDKICIPSIVQKCDNKALASFLRVLYDCEGSVQLNERAIEFTTGSEHLAKKLPALFLRYGIVSRARKTKKRFYRIMIYGKTNLQNFHKKIGFKHKEKSERLKIMIKKGKHDTNIDLIPGLGGIFWNILLKTGLTQKELARKIGISRRLLGMYISEDRNPSRERLKKIAKGLSKIKQDVIENETGFLNKLANSDLLWAKVEEVKEVGHNFKHVYDFTVDGNHNFIAGSGSPMIISNTSLLNALSLFIKPSFKVVSIEDTPELRLPHPHWIPHVARTPISIRGEIGEVSLFDLLKASLRQRPDYLVVGEVRGAEAYVLFQQIATGHPSMATIHAASIPQLVDRLITPPISLPPTLLENIDIIIFLVLARRKGKYVRRTNEILEVWGVEKDKLLTTKIFQWKPVSDEFEPVEKSKILEDIAKRIGLTEDSIKQELMRRKRILEWMKERGIYDYEEVSRIISTYYSNPEKVTDLVEM